LILDVESYRALYSVQVADSNFLDRKFRECWRLRLRVSTAQGIGCFNFRHFPLLLPGSFSTLVEAAESRFGAFVGSLFLETKDRM